MFKKLNQKVLVVFTFLMLLTVNAFAEGVADATVVSSFTTIKDDVIATLGAVAPLGLGIMGIFLAWRYGRKIFKIVAK